MYKRQHQGVEDMLKHYVPEVKAIVGEDYENAVEQGYTHFFPQCNIDNS